MLYTAADIPKYQHPCDNDVICDVGTAIFITSPSVSLPVVSVRVTTGSQRPFHYR